MRVPIDVLQTNTPSRDRHAMILRMRVEIRHDPLLALVIDRAISYRRQAHRLADAILFLAPLDPR